MTAPKSHVGPDDNNPGVYLPGRAGWKLSLTVCGLAVFCIGFTQLWPALRLVLFGARAQAVATHIIKSKPGSPDVVARDEGQPQAQAKAPSDDAIFWNEFSFETTAGQTITVRDNVGSRAQPLYPVIDTEGLPTTKLICYDVKRPTTAVFPGEISTWLVPAGLTLTGLGCALISAVLFYWAGKPIQLPEIAGPR